MSGMRAALRLMWLLAGFALAAYAALRLFGARPAGTASWLLGSAVAHDLILFPLYAGADASLVTALRRWPALGTVRGVAWINHLRFPVVISGLLLLVWAPLIFRLPARYSGITTLSTDPYLDRWLLATGILFAASAVLYAGRLWRHRRRDRGTSIPAQTAETSY